MDGCNNGNFPGFRKGKGGYGCVDEVKDVRSYGGKAAPDGMERDAVNTDRRGRYPPVILFILFIPLLSWKL